MCLPKSYVVVLTVLFLGFLAAMPFRHSQSQRKTVDRSGGRGVPQLRVVPLNVPPGNVGGRNLPTSVWSETTDEASTEVPDPVEVEGEHEGVSLAPEFVLPPPNSEDVSDQPFVTPGEMVDTLSLEESFVWHTIRDGETLESIALEYSGDEQLAAKILISNGDQISDPELLPIGAEIRIPTATIREDDQDPSD